MNEEMEAGRLYPRVVSTCVAVLLAFALAATGAAAQDEPLHGADFPLEAPLEEWVDPATALGFAEADLEPVPDVDLTFLAASPILATGVEVIEVEDDTLGVHIDEHLRAHQVAATVQRQIDDTNAEIAALRPRITELNDEITTELENEARLTFEIDRINAAIAEFAVRAFIGEEDLEVAFSEVVSDVGETKVLSDGVRDAQFEDIDAKELEREQRQRNRLDLEAERRRLRSLIDGLQANRLEQLAELRWVETLIDATAADHQRHLHRRLTDIVDGADFQLVALNAYVIAERTLQETQPECAIEWWMLAGIGRIESFHGRFGDSSLDHNGATTEPIYGPALDGRILEGEELLTAGTEIPEATGRTEDLPVAGTADAVDPAVADSTGAAPAGADAPAVGPDGEPIDPEAPVIRRLALIEDTDGGLLDDDTTYDRAVGPMQFIPQTWNLQEIDGNGDGETDPQNIYDAALASANYLCASAPSMATVEGQQQAYYAYNHDDEYTANVIAASEEYRALFTFPEPPVMSDAGELSSALIGDPEGPAEPTHWLGIGAFDAEAPTALDLDLDLPDW